MKTFKEVYNQTMDEVKKAYGNDLEKEEFINEFELDFMALNEIYCIDFEKIEKEFFNKINWDETYQEYKG